MPALLDNVVPGLVLAGLALGLAGLIIVRARRRATAPGAVAPSEAKFAGIIAIANDAIISVDARQVITDFNRGAEQIFGYDAAEVLGRPLDVLIPERFRHTHGTHLETFARSQVEARRMGERRQVEIIGLRKNGEEFVAEASISKMRLEDDWIFTVVLRDISPRRRREAADQFLARAGSALSGSLDHETTVTSVVQLAAELCDWAVVYNVQGGVLQRVALHTRFPELQEGLDALTGFPLDLSGSHPLRAALDTGQVELVHRTTPASLQDLAPDPAYRAVLERIGFASLIAAPLLARGEVHGAIGLYRGPAAPPFDDFDAAVVSDFAARAALAIDNARLYREARNAVQARNDVLSVVSHDLGNPLSAIFIGTRLLLRNVPEEERGRGGWQHLDSIRQAAEQMQKLIDDLLEVQRLESGRITLDRDRHEPESLVRRAVERLAPLAADRDIELASAADPELPHVWVDVHRLLQVFSNLIGNAIKFTPPGGIVSISAVADGAGRAIRFAVTDTGPGIALEDQPFVFDRFWQARRVGRHGAGLGLAIARGIVEAHGGRIWVESQPGAGATFRFEVPFASDGAGD